MHPGHFIISPATLYTGPYIPGHPDQALHVVLGMSSRETWFQTERVGALNIAVVGRLGRMRMPALFGYLIALSILLGGGYAGLQWLAAPDPRPAKPVAHRSAPEKTASSTTGTAPTASQANRNSGTIANSV